MYLFSKIFWLLFNPGSILLALSIMCVYAAWRTPKNPEKSQKSGWFVRLSILAMMLVMLGLNILPMRNFLVRPLEDAIPAPAAMPKHITGMIVLGGAIDGYLSPLRHEVIVTGAAARIIAAIRLAKQYPQAKIIYSGGSAALNNAGASEAILAGQLWREMGMSDAHLMLESRSRNTYENAVFSRELVQPQPRETWLLVTSAIHMPRALGVFRHVGWEVTPYPV
ncbi:MAG: YdcF family protein, partial [Alphaproteobacteria bacterium]|nr:YdcF family protein [Alphaproteobacteria bacterium]